MNDRREHEPLPDFLDLWVSRSGGRAARATDVLFECTHITPVGRGGVSVRRGSVVMGVARDVVRIDVADILGWSLEERGKLAELTVWARREGDRMITYRTAVLVRFARPACDALTDVLGAQRTTAPEE